MKNLIFQIRIALVVFFASRKRIIKLADVVGFNEYTTLKVVRKARVWAIMFVIFIIPFTVWFCLAMQTFFQWDMPFVTETGRPFDTHFQWLWYNFSSNKACAVVIFGAFAMKALLGIEWICWNKFDWEKRNNRSNYNYFHNLTTTRENSYKKLNY